MIVIAHTKFGLVRIQGSGVKRGAESAPRSERVFQILVQIGLRDEPFNIYRGATGFEMMHAIFFRAPLYANNFFRA